MRRWRRLAVQGTQRVVIVVHGAFPPGPSAARRARRARDSGDPGIVHDFLCLGLVAAGQTESQAVERGGVPVVELSERALVPARHEGGDEAALFRRAYRDAEAPATGTNSASGTMMHDQ